MPHRGRGTVGRSANSSRSRHLCWRERGKFADLLGLDPESAVIERGASQEAVGPEHAVEDLADDRLLALVVGHHGLPRGIRRSGRVTLGRGVALAVVRM